MICPTQPGAAGPSARAAPRSKNRSMNGTDERVLAGARRVPLAGTASLSALSFTVMYGGLPTTTWYCAGRGSAADSSRSSVA